MKKKSLVRKLIQKKLKISFAESCTGGLLAKSIVDVADASKVLDTSIVTYSNQSKVKYLGVKEDSIEKYGVVSEQVAIEMARGVIKFANSNIGVGISGIAGPTGGSKEKPVGTVCFGFVINDEEYHVTKHFPNQTRLAVKNSAANFVIEFLLEKLKNGN